MVLSHVGRRACAGALSLMQFVPLAAQAREPTGESAVDPAAASALLTGTILLPDGTPAAGAEVELRRYLLLDTNSLDVRHNRVAQQTQRVACGSDGTFHVELPNGLPFELRVQTGRSAIEVVRRVWAGETLTVHLRRGALLEGVVTRKSDGQPLRAAVRAWAPVSGVEVLRGQTDEVGHYFFASLPPDAITLEVQPSVGKAPEWAKLVLVPGRTLRHDVQVEDLEVLRGRVIDATTQRPIAGAEVSDSWTFDRSVRTDDDGRFLLHGMQWEELHAQAPGYGKLCLVPGANPRDVEIALRPGRKVRGRVVDAAGKPLANVYVAVTADARVDDVQQTDWLSLFTGGDGTFAFDAVRRDVVHCLFLRCDGRATLLYDFPDDENEHEEIDFGTLALPPAIYLTGRVTDENGVPIAGTPVSLGGAQDDRYRFCGGKQAKEPRGGFYVNGRNTVTDSLGRYHFADLGVGRYRVRARVEQVTPRLVGSSVIETETATVLTRDGQAVAQQDFRIVLGRNLRGGVMTASGEAPPMVTLLYGGEGAETSRLVVATGVPFRLFQLPPGKVVLEAAPCDAFGAPLADGDRVATRVVEASGGEGSASPPQPAFGDTPVWLCLPDPQWVQAFVVDGRGRPLAGVRVTASVANGSHLGARTTDERGSVAFFLGEQAGARLQVQGTAGGRPVDSELLASGTANAVLICR